MISTPHFMINGRLYRSTSLETELSRYQHASNTGVEGDQIWVNYTLTLPSVQIRDNGTTYQCILDPIVGAARYHSNIVTLIVNGEIVPVGT